MRGDGGPILRLNIQEILEPLEEIHCRLLIEGSKQHCIALDRGAKILFPVFCTLSLLYVLNYCQSAYPHWLKEFISSSCY